MERYSIHEKIVAVRLRAFTDSVIGRRRYSNGTVTSC